MGKNIVIVSPAYPYRGGQSLVEAHLFNELTKLGYDCSTITFTLLYPSLLFPGTTQFDQSEKVFFDHREKITRVINSINPFTWWKAYKKIKKINPDLTLFVWWMPFFGPAYSTIAWLLKRNTKSKISFLVENYVSHENRWFDKFASKVTLKKADAFLCQSQYVKDSLSKNHNQPIYKTTLSVYDCYDSGEFTKASAKETLGIKSASVVLFFGLIRKYKGLDKLIVAFKELLKQKPDTTLLIVGECYDDSKYYWDLIKENGIESQTVFIDKFIENEDIEPYFKASDLVCLPYNSATQSGILMMAYGFKRPVVVNDVGGLSELVGENKTGTVLQDNSPEKINEGILKVLEMLENENVEQNISGLNESLGYKNLNDLVSSIVKE